MSAHTPGPWTGGLMIDAGGVIIAKVQTSKKYIGASGFTNPKGPDEATAIANARLIAAAPELLAALKEIANWGAGSPQPIFDRIRAAIHKATGGKP